MDSGLTQAQVEDIAEEAANRALAQLMLVLGVDTKSPQSVLEFQADLMHVRKWRKSVEQVQHVGMATAIGVLVTGMFGLLWLAIQVKLGGR